MTKGNDSGIKQHKRMAMGEKVPQGPHPSPGYKKGGAVKEDPTTYEKYGHGFRKKTGGKV